LEIIYLLSFPDSLAICAGFRFYPVCVAKVKQTDYGVPASDQNIIGGAIKSCGHISNDFGVYKI